MLMVKLRFRRWAPSLVPIFEEQFCLAIELTLFYWYSLTICITGYVKWAKTYYGLIFFPINCSYTSLRLSLQSMLEVILP